MTLLQWLFGPYRYGWVIYNRFGQWADKAFESEEAARIYVRGTVASWDNDPRFDRFEDQFQYRRSRIEPDSILCTEAQAIFRLNSKVGAKRAEIRAMYTAAGLEPPELSR